jgi:hypothetical protein
MAGAFAKHAFSGENGYRCNGRHPHLELSYQADCEQVVTARIRSSSSVYFSANMSALTIPPWSNKAVQAVESSFDLIKEMEEYGNAAVRKVIKNQVLKKVSPPITLDDLVEAYEMIKNNKVSSRMMTAGDVFVAEYDVLCRGAIKDDEYIASISTVPPAFHGIFDSITVVEKLTVVSALVGFTRINPWDGTIDSPQLAPLSKGKKKWLPAVKMLGEGIFIKFNKKALINGVIMSKIGMSKCPSNWKCYIIQTRDIHLSMLHYILSRIC